MYREGKKKKMEPYSMYFSLTCELHQIYFTWQHSISEYGYVVIYLTYDQWVAIQFVSIFLNMASNESKNILIHILFHLPVFISIINISRNGLEIMYTSVIINYIKFTFQNCYCAQINNLSKHI